MLFMNEGEIEQAVAQYRNDPVLSRATRLLQDLMELANQVSDGWCYWPKPCRAAKKLQELIQRGRDRSFRATEDDLKAAVTPIKAFLTRERANLRGRTLSLP